MKLWTNGDCSIERDLNHQSDIGHPKIPPPPPYPLYLLQKLHRWMAGSGTKRFRQRRGSSIDAYKFHKTENIYFTCLFIESKNTNLHCIVFGLGRCTWTWGVLNKTLVFTSETRRSYQQHFMPSWRSWCREFHAKFKAGYDIKIVTVLDYTFLIEMRLL